MRLLLIIGLQWGVRGVVLSDIIVTAVFTLVLVPWFAALVRPVFSRQLLIESLRFGLPRLPHGVAQQIMGASDRYVLGRFVSLHEVGVYSTGSSLGQGMKLFLELVRAGLGAVLLRRHERARRESDAGARSDVRGR